MNRWIRVALFCAIVIVSGIVFLIDRPVSWNSLDGNSQEVLKTIYDSFKDGLFMLHELRVLSFSEKQSAHIVGVLVEKDLIRRGLDKSLDDHKFERYCLTEQGIALVKNHQKKRLDIQN